MKNFKVVYCFYDGSTEFIRVKAKNEHEASVKAIDWLDENLPTDKWDIEDIIKE